MNFDELGTQGDKKELIPLPWAALSALRIEGRVQRPEKQIIVSYSLFSHTEEGLNKLMREIIIRNPIIGG